MSIQKQTYCVTYCLEQGFVIDVSAASAEEAERIVEQYLDEEHAPLPDSEIVHHNGFVLDCQE